MPGRADGPQGRALGCHPGGDTPSGHPRAQPAAGVGSRTLPEEGCSCMAAIAAAPRAPQGGRGTCPLVSCGFSPPGVGDDTRFPGGTFSGSGNSEFYSGCSSECTKGKGFRSRSLKLPHFSLSQMMVSAFGLASGGRQGVLGGRQEPCRQQGGAGRGYLTLWCLSRSGKFAHHPLPACRRLWPALTKTDPTVSTGVTGGGRGWGWAVPGTIACAGMVPR